MATPKTKSAPKAAPVVPEDKAFIGTTDTETTYGDVDAGIKSLNAAITEEPVVNGEFTDAAVTGDHPTPEEARTMFEERPDLSSILTTEGWLRREESKTLTLSGVFI